MARIHVFRGKDLVPLDDQPFASEAEYQELLADHPELMPGEMIDTADPPRFALIIREAGIALAGGDGGNRWSLDHLFVDHNSVPTLVEVKRAEDTRARREVVAQMLDYAANLRSWQPGKGRDVFHERCASENLDPTEVLDAAFDVPIEDHDNFWAAFDRNVTGGNLRLIFVADKIVPELTNIIEFLDSQFKVADVMAVEIRQLTGSLDDDSPGERAFISEVKGKTAAATAAKTSGSRPRIEDHEFRAMVHDRAPAFEALFDGLMVWCENRGGWVSFGTGGSYPACYLNFRNVHGTSIWAFQPALSKGGPPYVAVRFDGLSRRYPFDNDELRSELRDRLNAIPGVSLEGDGHPSFPLSVLTDPERLREFMVVADWFADQVAAPDPNPTSST